MEDYFCLGTSEILGDDEGLEAQVLDGSREVLKKNVSKTEYGGRERGHRNRNKTH